MSGDHLPLAPSAARGKPPPIYVTSLFNFACILGLAAIGIALLYDKELGLTDAGKLLLKSIHVWIGYVFVLNLVWRIVWAFIGNPHARWTAILPFRSGYIAESKSYIRGLIQGDAQPYVGHNPIVRAIARLCGTRNSLRIASTLRVIEYKLHVAVM